jgi:hypothetical protein
MERLAQLLKDRVVAILLHGGSVAQLAHETATVSAAKDVVWVGINHFALLEEQMLAPGGASFSLVFCCADGEVARRLADLRSYLDRPEPRLLVTRQDQFAAHADVLAPVAARILLAGLPPLWPYPNSLTLLLRLLCRAAPRRIVLCGADGFLGEDSEVIASYYGAESFRREGRLSGVLRDTLLFNAHFPRLQAAWRSASGAASPDLVNCSPGTVLRGIPVIGYDQLPAALAGAPLAAIPATEPPLLPIPDPVHGDNPAAALARCANAARAGDLPEAQRHALHALYISPPQLSPLAFRVLQTDPAVLRQALRFLKVRGAEDPSSSEHWRWLELQGEARQAAAATIDWESWS